MNNIIGKVLVKETGLGIPNLVVAIYDLDPHTKPEELIDDSGREEATGIRDRSVGIQGDRIGSAITGSNGNFDISYDEKEFRIRNKEKRPDLLLVITAPEEPGVKLVDLILFTSEVIRQNAGRVEHYVIQLSVKQLGALNLPAPKDKSSAEPLIEAITLADKNQKRLDIALRSLSTQRIDEQRISFDQFNTNFLPKYIESITRFPSAITNESQIVRNDADVGLKNKQVITDNITKITQLSDPENTLESARTTRYFLSEDQEVLLNNVGEGEIINSDDLNNILLLGGAGSRSILSAFLLREDRIGRACLQATTQEKCSDDVLDVSSSSRLAPPINEVINPATENGGGESSTKEDVPKYIFKMMNTVTSPEEIVQFGLTPNISKKADADSVQESVDNFSLRSSPADVPSFHDFHKLHIAFDHVWQEIFDKSLFDLVEASFMMVNSVGGDPLHERYAGIGADVALAAELKMVRQTIDGKKIPNVMYKINHPDEGRFDVGEESVIVDNFEEPDLTHGDPNHGGGAGQVRDAAGDLKNSPDAPATDPYSLLVELEKIMREDYSFTAFAANGKEYSVNYGVNVTYRQKWDPVAYQAGELAKTITLAPNETRNFTHKTKVTRKRSDKEISNNLNSRKEEFNTTTRAESEIINKALNKNNFQLVAEDIGGVGDVTLNIDAEKESNETKKNFREAVMKAAQEYKNERTMEVSTEDDFSDEFSESGKLENSNEEITVTYLFYELQRRYRISEEIHRVTPVVMVAQVIPNPRDINSSWLIKHDWILKRVLLDDSFIPALQYLVLSIEGDRFSLRELEKSVSDQRAHVNGLKQQVIVAQKMASDRYEALLTSITNRSNEVGDDENDGFFTNLWEDTIGGGESHEALRIVEESARESEQRAVEKLKALTTRFEQEVTALNSAIEKFTDKLTKHKNQLVQVARLRVHIKQNILYYMQAIWRHEPPDQRFLRLQHVKVPTFEGEIKYKFIKKDEDLIHLGVNDTANEEDINIVQTTAHEFEIITDDISVTFDKKTLVEIADLDTVVGFKGNYMIFPLKETNPLVELMMSPYVDSGWSLLDPDEMGNMNRQEFSRFVCCLHKNLTSEQFDEVKPLLKAQYRQILKMPVRPGEELIIPTGSLFIEALPGTHAVLEDFKLTHRAIDVKKAQAEVREMELENVRLAARLLNQERDDPDVDAKYVFEGSGSVVAPSPTGDNS